MSGYTHKLILSCGCTMDWNDREGIDIPQVGWWFRCQRHSRHVGGYDPDDGSPNLDRDQQVIKVKTLERL